LEKLSQILETFESVGLGDIESVKLLNRVDTKFVFAASKLENLLQQLSNDYYVLEIENCKRCDYLTVYYDTAEYYFYYQHQTGRYPRGKVRVRTYLNTGQTFLEIKIKNNHSKTFKDRIVIKSEEDILKKKSKKFIESRLPVSTDELKPDIKVRYSRITLVSRNFSERLTIDMNLSFEFGDNSTDLKQLAILELKQDKNSKSPARAIMLKERIFKSGLSKYCLGIAFIHPEVKTNNIKEKIRKINKLCCYESI